MLRESELAKPTKDRFKTIERVRKFLIFLYSGKEFMYNGYTYKMDGDFNPYIVAFSEKGNVPLFRNEGFWNELMDIVTTMSDEEFDKINLEVATIVALNQK